MSGKTIQPETIQTSSSKRLLVFMAAVLAVSAAIVFGSMVSNESAAVTGEVDRRIDHGVRHPDETSLAPATPVEQNQLTRPFTRYLPVPAAPVEQNQLTRPFTRYLPVSDPAESRAPRTTESSTWQTGESWSL